MEKTQTGTLLDSQHVSQHSNIVSTQSIQGLIRITEVISEKAVVVFSVSTCCICHAVKRLLSSLGVSPAVYELDQERDGPDIEAALQKLTACSQALPAVYIGSQYLGGLDQLIAAHICGALVPQLKEAGALWL
ncbi:hypothetical protein O6H91_16G011700 [Diphasiastrum complanatum]|uniref:Uncharacterized protein n=1 Tax=Diphasiastrum complanatum TaxID=34168 RepID=A0ACC2B9Y9_DIPCM|nr:hypothetical protein O6H91_16G011700 [Diphasiastrum complanatum]